MINILLIGHGAREHAIARAISQSKQKHHLFAYCSYHNHGIAQYCQDVIIGKMTDDNKICEVAKEHKIHFAIIGPEGPLASGVVDALERINIPSIGPHKDLAQIETSKSFARNFLKKHHIDASPKFKSFDNMEGVEEFLKLLDDQFVIKADGLMSGKGVKLSGVHLADHYAGLDYCKDLLKAKKTFIIEEKLIGQEFSLMSFCANNTAVHMPVIQDHKRAHEGDTGPNTGGMGSYSDKNHSLPFLNEEDIRTAQKINELTIAA